MPLSEVFLLKAFIFHKPVTTGRKKVENVDARREYDLLQL